MDLWVWRCSPVGNACTLEPVENVDEFLRFRRAIPFKDTFPPTAQARMSKSFKKDTKLIDDVTNGDAIKICSKRLVEFLKKKNLKNMEYLPITILDHKGKVASKDYCIVHPIVPQDALDRKASKPEHNKIRPKDIDTVENLIVDTARVDAHVRVFRLADFTGPVLIDKALAAEIEAAGFVGPYFQALARYGK